VVDLSGERRHLKTGGLLLLILVVCLMVNLTLPGCRPEATLPPDATQGANGPEGADGTGGADDAGEDTGNAAAFTNRNWHIRERLNPGARGPDLPDGTIPFIILDSTLVGREETAARLAYWDTVSGRVSLDERPLFRLTRTSPMSDAFLFKGLAWDGGGRIGVALGEAVVLSEVHPLYTVDIIAPPADLRHWVGSPRLLALCPSDEPDRFILLTHYTLDIQSYPHPLSGEAGVPGDAEPTEESYFLRHSGTLIGLIKKDGLVRWALATIGGPEAPTAWTVLEWYVLEQGEVRSDRLDTKAVIVEAGPGNRWAFDGRRVWMATPKAEVRFWDLELGEDNLQDEANEALRAFGEPYRDRMEFASPPGLFASGDILVVHYRPYVVEGDPEASGVRVLPLACVLALRDARVIGQITLRGEHLTVIKNGRVSQEMEVPPEIQGHWWFPGVQEIEPR